MSSHVYGKKLLIYSVILNFSNTAEGEQYFADMTLFLFFSHGGTWTEILSVTLIFLANQNVLTKIVSVIFLGTAISWGTEIFVVMETSCDNEVNAIYSLNVCVILNEIWIGNRNVSYKNNNRLSVRSGYIL